MDIVPAEHERLAALKAFDETKAGVKGLVDAGVSKIPSIFIHPLNDDQALPFPTAEAADNLNIPIIDFTGVEKDLVRRKDIVDEIRNAAERWGFFQVVNHGIPVSILEEMLQGIRRFFEQENEVKKGYYSMDKGKKVMYYSNLYLYLGAPADWRDSIRFRMAPDPPNPEDLPTCCREIIVEFSHQVMNLGNILFGLLSEALGLQASRLNAMGCSEGLTILGHYYPPCPQPHLATGTTLHSDADFMTVLLQDQVGGLQVQHDNKWVDVPPVHGALVVNIGDILQMITNDRYKSVIHRVVANSSNVPRVSIAGFFRNTFEPVPKLYGPIRELISEDNPPRYREATMKEIYAYRQVNGLADNICTPFRL